MTVKTHHFIVTIYTTGLHVSTPTGHHQAQSALGVDSLGLVH